MAIDMYQNKAPTATTRENQKIYSLANLTKNRLSKILDEFTTRINTAESITRDTQAETYTVHAINYEKQTQRILVHQH